MEHTGLNWSSDVKKSLRGVWQEQATMKHGELCWVLAARL
jgi:hypothetical protein